MNIYLDIDGTIRGVASPLDDIIEFLEYCLDHFSGHVYWLTSYCRHGVNYCNEALAFLPESLQARLEKEVQPTDWDVSKTDAIDFSEPFVWVDDNIFDAQLRILAEHDADGSAYRTNPSNPESIKEALGFIRQRSENLS